LPESWETPISTEIGPVRWSKVTNPCGQQHVYAMLVEQEDLLVGRPDGAVPGHPVLVGYLSVEDPTAVDEETRRDSDPTDLRIDTIWLHPNLRDRGVGTAMQTVAKEHGLFESHSANRTKAGSALAAAIGDDLAPAEEFPDDDKFDSGGRRFYKWLLAAHPDLQGVAYD
jgi:hypothetical protein